MFVGQSMVGFSVSLTVTVKLHCAPSPVELVTVVVPKGNEEPEGGDDVTWTALPHSSVAVAEKLTTAEHWPEAAAATIFAGQWMMVVDGAVAGLAANFIVA
jgi:hypothetical protein